MAKQVKGFLAADGTFFETEPECRRYEYAQAITTLCESHGISHVNFFTLIQEWHTEIKGYYYADDKCAVKQVIPTGSIKFEDDISQSSDDNEDAPIGDKDAPAFLQQSLRRGI